MVTAPLCVARCAIPRRHTADCTDQDCPGCQPAQAADGSRLCQRHGDRIGSDALALAELHTELDYRLMAGVGTGDKVSGTPEGGRVPSPAAIEVRSDIRSVLVAWCLLISDERGFALPHRQTVQERPWGFIGPMPMVRVPDESTGALAAFVANSATWLAAHPAAADASRELDELRRRAYGIAYPAGSKRVDLGRCPRGPGNVTATVRTTDTLLPALARCDCPEPHEWSAAQWHSLAREQARMAVRTPEEAA